MPDLSKGGGHAFRRPQRVAAPGAGLGGRSARRRGAAAGPGGDPRALGERRGRGARGARARVGDST